MKSVLQSLLVIMVISLGTSACAQQAVPDMLQEVFQSAFNGQWLPIQQALEKGFQPDQADPEGRTALMLAAYNGHTMVVEKLMEAGADPNARDSTGSTALMFASSGPFPDTVKVLIAKGAEVNAIDSNEHFSPLMWAAAEGQAEIAQLLLENKADPSLTDIDGDTAQSFAAKAGHTDVVRILEEFNGAPEPEINPQPDSKDN